MAFFQKSIEEEQAELMEDLYYIAYLDFVSKERTKEKEEK
jgi:hypothetical protein